MDLREAAQQALDALEDSHQNINPERRYADELTRQIADSITALRAALADDSMQRLTDVQQKIENDSFDKQPASGIHLGVCNGADRDVEAMTDVQQEMDCYGDGNVYRGQRSKDSKTQTLTFSKAETVEPVAYVTGFSKGYAVIQPVDRSLLMPVGMALYRSPPKREPLLIEGNEFIGDPPAPAKTWGEYFENVVTTSRLSGLRVSALANPVAHEFAGVKITEVRLPENMAMRFDGDVLVIERAHGIGGEE